MHGSYTIEVYGYLDDKIALSRYSAGCGADNSFTIRECVKEKFVLATRLESLLQQTCMALFPNSFL